MKPVAQFLAAITLAASTWTGAYADVRKEGPCDTTLSPYFFVKNSSTGVDQLPLKSTSAEVNIAGVIADVRISQIYKNEGSVPLEAIYIFPASTRAAVYGMKMIIGERIITAKIRKKDDARREYELAKDQGRSASLLEQQRPNVFQMNVANIMPGDLITVELSYTELLTPTDKTYEFVYPTVVGPRYSNTPSSSGTISEKWVDNPYLHQGEALISSFAITVNMAAGLPIQKLFCTSHKVQVNYKDASHAVVTLDKSEEHGGSRDYVLKYRLAGDRVESGLLLYQGEKENFFLLMMEPPKRIALEQIPGREYIFIVDVSGSMYGFPLDISKELLRNLIGNLRSSDRFNVLLFSGGSTLMSEQSLPATQENIKRAVDVIDKQHGDGGTELLPALKRALVLPRQEGYSRTIIMVTDGYVSVEEESFDLIRKNLGKANMFAFGIGSSVNRHLIEGMAHAGMGVPFVITKPDEASAQAEAFRKMIQSPVLTGIKAEFNGFDVHDVEPAGIPDLFAERPVVLFGKWRGKPQGTITIRGLAGDRPYEESIDVSSIQPAKANAALPYLWARHRITLLSDYNMLRQDDGRIKEVTNLGLAYNLLTAYTSFVAVDSEIRNKGDKAATIKQPLPLPDGVSDYAVGGIARSIAAAPMVQGRGFALPEEKKEDSEFVTEPAKAKKKDEQPASIKIFSISSGLEKKAVLNVIKKHVSELNICNQGKGLSGKIVLKLILTAGGAVKEVIVLSREIGGVKNEQRIAGIIGHWQFPVSGKNVEETVTVSLQFLP